MRRLGGGSASRVEDQRHQRRPIDRAQGWRFSGVKRDGFWASSVTTWLSGIRLNNDQWKGKAVAGWQKRVGWYRKQDADQANTRGVIGRSLRYRKAGGSRPGWQRR